MADTLDNALLEAYELIEANRIDEARAILTPLLDDYPDEPDLWWVYSHAVDSEQEAIQALSRVVELDPNHAQAARLLEASSFPRNFEDEISSPPKTGITPLERPKAPIESLPMPDLNADTDSFDDFDDDTNDFETASSDSNERNWFLLGGFALVLVFASVLVLFFALSNTQPPTPTQTAQVALNSTETVEEQVGVPATNTPIEANASSADSTDTTEPATSTPDPTATEEATEPATDTPDPTATEEATEPATDTPDPTATEEATEPATDTPDPTTTDEPPTATARPSRTPSPEPTVDPFIGLAASLENTDAVLSTNPPSIGETSLGETLIVEFCAEGADRRSTTDAAFDALLSVDLEDIDVEALAVSLYNCETDQTLRVIGVSLADVEAFQADEITEREFQLGWSVVG